MNAGVKLIGLGASPGDNLIDFTERLCQMAVVGEPQANNDRPGRRGGLEAVMKSGFGPQPARIQSRLAVDHPAMKGILDVPLSAPVTPSEHPRAVRLVVCKQEVCAALRIKHSCVKPVRDWNVDKRFNAVIVGDQAEK